MIWYYVGGALALLICLWGIGVAILVLPPRWRVFWPVLCPACGIALQSLVVWITASAGLPGTKHWAGAALGVPLAISALAVWRVGGLRKFGRILSGGARRFWPQWLFMAVCFVAITYPLTRPPGYLNAISLGSCDAGDYAAGGRVFAEFSRADRSGFMGESDVTRVGSATNFYEFWRRINHFTPSALLALNGPTLGREPHELVSILGVVLFILNTPAVFWLARAGFRLRAAAAGVTTLLYGGNPLLLYAVYHTALAQLIGAPAVALLIWTGLRLFRAAHIRAVAARRRALWSWAGLMFVCHWLILGSYNFALLFCYAPLFIYAGAQVCLTRQWRAGVRWLGFLLLQIILAIALFPARALTVLERVSLFQAASFGWKIPTIGPAGWFGIFANERLLPAGLAISDAAGAVLFLVAISCLFVFAHKDQHLLARVRARSLLGVSFLLSSLVGYLLLLHEQHGTGSYDAYKLFSLFYPGTLAALCLWLEPGARAKSSLRFWGPLISFAAIVLAGQTSDWIQFNAAVRRSDLILDRPLLDLQRIESLPQVDSINVMLEPVWQRLWANAFLLRHPQYFALPTYEGRRVTELRGTWILRSGQLLVARTTEAQDTIDLNAGYYLVRRTAPARLDISFGKGWFLPEQRRDEHWRWAGNDAEIILENPHSYPLEAVLRIRGRTLSDDRVIEINSSGDPKNPWRGIFGAKWQSVDDVRLQLMPGQTVLTIHSAEPLPEGSADDSRSILFALSRLEVEQVQAASPTTPQT